MDTCKTFSFYLALTLALTLAGITPAISALGGKYVQVGSSKIHGRIGTIGYVFDSQGHPVLAEYDSEGKWVSDLGWNEAYRDADILSGVPSACPPS